MVIMDVVLAEFVVAVITVGFVSVVRIMCIVVVDETSAVTAVGVVIFIAVMTEVHYMVSFCFLTPDAVKTAVTNGGEFLETVVAHEMIVEFVQGIFGKFCSAMEAGELFRHGFVLLKCSLFWFCTVEIIYK